MSDGILGRSSIIKSPTIRPIHWVSYHAGPKARVFEGSENINVLSLNVIETAQTEWNSPVLFALKKEGTWRFSADYRNLSAVTISASCPLPKMDECIDSRGDRQGLSTIHANRGYLQIEVDTSDHQKIALTSQHVSHQFSRKLFSLKNATAAFSVS